MISNTGTEIFNYANNNIVALKRAPYTVLNVLKRIVSYIMAARTTITVVMCAWLITISYFIIRKTDPADTYDANDPSRTRYYNLHRVWFGDDSSLLILFKIWYYTFIFIMLGPILRELFVFTKLILAL